MAIDLTYVKKNNYVLASVGKDFTIHEYNTAMIALLANDLIPNQSNALWDLREIILNKKIISLFESISSRQYQFERSRGKETRIAILVNKMDKEFKHFIQYEIKPKSTKNTRFFTQLDEAEKWLI